jgi:XRE family transcriptional regulator, aerobic/anaerobic benzoate catabolism transcriptional regulator
MEPLLTSIGARVRARRQARDWTIKSLAERSGVSVRFLIELEKGRGNISVGRLSAVADALGEPLVAFFLEAPVARIVAQLRGLKSAQLGAIERTVAALEGAPPRRFVALLGVRGAGKSTVGRQVAECLGMDFVELDARIEALAGLSLAEIFAIHGEPYYRRIEFEALSELVAEGRDVVVATGGSVVAHDESWQLLREHSRTVWLQADAQEHWDRVIAQGDHRPMNENPEAFAQLKALLQNRAPRYAEAEVVVETSRRTLKSVIDDVIAAI